MLAAPRPLLAPALIAGTLVVAAPASAAALPLPLSSTLQTRGATTARCHARLASGPGIVRRTVDASANALVAARLSRGRGDWDLGVFDAAGHSLGGSAVPGTEDLAQAPVSAAGPVTVQACRRRGASHAVHLTATLVPMASSRRARLVARRAEKADVLQASAARARATRRGSRQRSPGNLRLPSGRHSYRQLPDYEADLKALATEHPGSVREVVLPHSTLIGRTVVGVEIARDVRRSDGRPVMLITGLHHSREWPSGEVTMEWAMDLVQSLERKDPRVRGLLAKARVIAVPVVNPDGFFLSRTVAGTFEFKRKNCRVVDGQVPRPGQCEAAANARLGVDPNRNYGGFWGGPGASVDPTDDAYRGAGPFSEAESQNIHELIEGRQVTVALSNHTYGNLLLRPPSLRDQAPPDADALKRLGDAIAAPADLHSEPAYDLYDTTGAMEDWSYWSTGGLAFTAEIGADQADDPTGLIAFHPPFAQTVAAYPGLREGFLRALAWTADPANHSIIDGRGPRGATIELSREFHTSTSPVLRSDGLAGPALTFLDRLHSTLRIGGSGRFAFHANPSTRPAAMGRPGRSATGPTTAPVAFASPGTTTSFTYTQPGASDAPASARADFPFTIAPGEDDARATVRIAWANAANDFDLYVFRVAADGTETLMGASGQADTTWEQAELVGDPVNSPLPAGTYVARVVDYASTDKAFNGQITFAGPSAPVAATPERWTLTCRVGGRAVGSTAVLVARGQRVDVGAACR